MKCPTHLFQCGNECVDPRLMCDGVINCLDGSDEGLGCLSNNCSSLRKPQCQHYCVSTPRGAVSNYQLVCGQFHSFIEL